MPSEDVEFLEEPNPVHRLDKDMNLPLSPRLLDATWSFQVITRFSMKGTMDCVTISRRKALMAAASDSRMNFAGAS